MNYRNYRIQEANRIRATAQTQVAQNQVHDTRANHVHGYRSLGFYQGAREVSNASRAFVVGSGVFGGTLVS
jgi:hypothetical protein